jgi:uncharacterized membrane protein YfcA
VRRRNLPAASAIDDRLEIATFAFAGFLAQLVDGALGMAYGVTCSSLLLAFGYSPAAASASVHLAEVATSGVSGHFHWKLGNVDRAIFKALVLPGVLGGVLGAYALSVLPGERLRPWVAAYLCLMGIRILYKAHRSATLQTPRGGRIGLLGFVGGFMDAMGGGGWGPIVTTTLVGNGHDPRVAIGSVNRAEFFVTLAESFTFISTVGISNWRIVLGLCLGGVVAAPLAAHLTRWLPVTMLMTLVGGLIVILSLRTIAISAGLM